MGDRTGFLKHDRELPRRRSVEIRVRDWREVYEPFSEEDLRVQASRCMDCGIPFCHEGCPLGNLIPEWNDLVYRGDWPGAAERLHATNNFPELTGRLCPAPCEEACVLGIASDAVTIKQVELETAEWAHAHGWASPVRTSRRTSKRVAVVGSGPAGLACAQQLTRAGHEVVVFERAERPGGLLRYGIPEFKLEKRVLDRRLEQMEAEGTTFVTRVEIGSGTGEEGAWSAGEASRVPGSGNGSGVPGAAARDAERVPASTLIDELDAVVLAVGSTVGRDLRVPGRDLAGVHLAMEYLKPANLVQEGAIAESPVSARGKRVVIIGGGDTGADCLGTAHRQGAVSVHQFEILQQPPDRRSERDPWPLWPLVLRTSAAHEEGGERLFAVETTELVGDPSGAVRSLRYHKVEMKPHPDGKGIYFEPVPGTASEIECDLVLLALGFTGPEPHGALEAFGAELTDRGNVMVGPSWETGVEGVFACGDAVRGQSLVVWAIAEGRSAAAAVDRYLMGSTMLPEPITPGRVAMR